MRFKKKKVSSSTEVNHDSPQIEKIKIELKELYPEYPSFIQHTLVAEMCLKWHNKKIREDQNKSTS